MSNASADPRYTAAKRAYTKGFDALNRIEDALRIKCSTEHYSEDGLTYQQELAWADAFALIDAAGKTLNRELDAITKECGVGVYKPYGRSGPRRY